MRFSWNTLSFKMRTSVMASTMGRAIAGSRHKDAMLKMKWTGLDFDISPFESQSPMILGNVLSGDSLKISRMRGVMVCDTGIIPRPPLLIASFFSEKYRAGNSGWASNKLLGVENVLTTRCTLVIKSVRASLILYLILHFENNSLQEIQFRYKRIYYIKRFSSIK